MKKKKSSTSASSKNLVETHCISSLPYVPKPISHIVPVHNQDQSWLLVARDSGEIEIYTVDQGEVFLERVLPGGKNKAISSMVGAKLLLKEDTLPFSKPTFSTSSRSNTTYKPTLAQSVRLFTGSLNGTITEWNLDTLVPKFTMDVCVSGVWSLAVNHASTQLAVGGDDGSLFVYDIISPCYTTPILLPLVGQWRYPNHRLLHITYHPTMNAVYACTDDSKVLHFPLSNLPIRHVEVSGPVGMPLTKKKKKKNLKNKTSSTSVQEKSSTKITCWCSTWCYEDDRRTPLLVVGTSVGSVVIVQMDTFTLLHTLSVSPTFVDVIQVSNLGTLVYAATLDGKVTVLQRGGDPLGFQVVQTRQWQAHDLKALTVMSVPYLSPLDPLGNPKNQKATVMRPWLVTGGM
ncbi:U3 small nucleolar RNA-associated protein 4 [Coelomomyces lativittatus]|nr:U3 small nucleolar RNA-associated protein 4 [Coelomomyces lativittatus]